MRPMFKLAVPPPRVEALLREQLSLAQDALREAREAVSRSTLRARMVSGRSTGEFRRLFPAALADLYEEVLSSPPGPERFLRVLQRRAAELGLKLDALRPQAQPLERHHALRFLSARLPAAFKELTEYYAGRTDRLREPAEMLGAVEGMAGHDEGGRIIAAAWEGAHLAVQRAEVEELLNRADEVIEANYAKIRERPEVNASLLAYMASNALNFRRPHLFQHLAPGDAQALKAQLLWRKEVLQLKGHLLALAKLLADAGEWEEGDLPELIERLDAPAAVERLREGFHQGLAPSQDLLPVDAPALKKALVFLHFRRRGTLESVIEGLEALRDDPVFGRLLEEESASRYARFVQDAVLPLLEASPAAVQQMRAILSDPDGEYASLPPVLREFREVHLPQVGNAEALRRPFLPFEASVVGEVDREIQTLREGFNALKPGVFLERATDLLNHVAERVVFWDDFKQCLDQFGSAFLHYQRLSPLVISSFTRLCTDYLSNRLRAADLTDLPPHADPQTLLFEGLWNAHQRDQLLSLDPLFDEPLPFPLFQERLFELKLPTPYRDFYRYLQEYFQTGGLPLLREVLPLLAQEDRDNAFAQGILQEMSFLPDMDGPGVLGLLLGRDALPPGRKAELRQRLWGMRAGIAPDFREALAAQGLLPECSALELSPSERFFLQILEGLGLEAPARAFEEHLAVLDTPAPPPSPGGARWEHQFIPHRHYLIQIEPLGGEVRISLNVSGFKAGPHPFEGRVLRQAVLDPAVADMQTALGPFHSFIAFLRELEEAVFVAEFVRPPLRRGLQVNQRGADPVISFARREGRFALQPALMEQTLAPKLKKIWRSFLAPKEGWTDSDRDIGTSLQLLAPHLLVR